MEFHINLQLNAIESLTYSSFTVKLHSGRDVFLFKEKNTGLIGLHYTFDWKL